MMPEIIVGIAFGLLIVAGLWFMCEIIDTRRRLAVLEHNNRTCAERHRLTERQADDTAERVCRLEARKPSITDVDIKHPDPEHPCPKGPNE